MSRTETDLSVDRTDDQKFDGDLVLRVIRGKEFVFVSESQQSAFQTLLGG